MQTPFSNSLTRTVLLPQWLRGGGWHESGDRPAGALMHNRFFFFYFVILVSDNDKFFFSESS